MEDRKRNMMTEQLERSELSKGANREKITKIEKKIKFIQHTCNITMDESTIGTTMQLKMCGRQSKTFVVLRGVKQTFSNNQ